MKKPFALILVLAAFCSLGAEYRTTNFVVINPNPQVCELVGKWAEHYRREKAVEWLGREMPNWPEPCPLRVSVSMEGPSGETEFTFGGGRVTSQRMQIRGPLDRLIQSVLPHEVTHTVFAHHFKTPVPRWADEGGSVLSEDDTERERHDKVVRGILNKGQQIPMRTLMALREYPPQVMCLYAQGYSMSGYLVMRSNKQHFLNFVGHGMHYGWDHAAKSHYGHGNVEELEQAWLKHLRDTKGLPSSQVFAASKPATESQPIARGTMPTTEQVSGKSGASSWQSGVNLQAPVPVTTPIMPRISAITPSVQLGAPVLLPRELVRQGSR